MRIVSPILSLLLAVSLLCALPALPAAATEEGPRLVMTEVCFNPTYQENSADLAESADVLEYMEVVNMGGADVDLTGATLRYSTEGPDGDHLSNPILTFADNPATLAPGEIAVIAIYSGDSVKAGLTYHTEEGLGAIYDLFVSLHGCGESLDRASFYLSPSYESGGGKVEGRFNLGNGAENAHLLLADGAGNTLCEVDYNAALWNRNGYAMNLLYREGLVEGRPTASRVFNVGACTPGSLRENQLSAEGMTPTGDTTPLRVMQYNICASDSEQTHPDGSKITFEERAGYVFDEVAAYAPDVLGLCEVNYLWIPHIQKTLCEEGGMTAFGCSSDGNEYGVEMKEAKWDLTNLILWRTDKYEAVESGYFWCATRTTRPGCTWKGGITGDFNRCINWVILEEKATGAQFFFLCAHIDAKVPEARALSASLIVEQAESLSRGLPVIMVGDWNANEKTEAYENLVAGPFRDARYRCADYEDMGIYGTYNKWGENDNLTDRPPIDHCFISPDSVFVEKATMDFGFFDEENRLYAADHNPTYFDLRVAVTAISDETQPETEAPATDAPATEAPATEAPATEAPATDTPATDTPAAGIPVTEAPAESGCGSALGVAILPLAALGLILRKRKD